MPPPSVLDCLFLDSPRIPDKSRRFFHQLFRAARSQGLRCAMSRHYQPCEMLVIFGLGGEDRYRVGMDHMVSGKPLISWDLGYWSRNVRRRKYRVSLNGFHPSQVMFGPRPSGDRFNSGGQQLTTVRHKKDAPILLIGSSPKSIKVGAKGWSAAASREIREQFPEHRVIYRPKPRRPVERDVDYDGLSTGPIETILPRVSLVYCLHSNVAVDACKMGVPVIAKDGAAALIYPNRLCDYQNQPSAELREEFLHRLAYWQWSEEETESFWNWFFEAFPVYDHRRIPEKPSKRKRRTGT